MVEALAKRVPGETCTPEATLILERKSVELRKEILKQKHLKYRGVNPTLTRIGK